MLLFIDKYKPKSIDEIKHNKELCFMLKRILNNKNNISNLLIYGKEGNGKYTFVKLILKKLYGDSIDNTRIKTFDIKNKKVKINYLCSSYHIEIDLRLYKQWDKYIINDFLKSLVYTNNVGHNIHKIIVMLHSECLSHQSQYALRCIIEKTKYTARYIFTCNSYTKMADPIISRFLCLRLKTPTEEETTSIIKDICKIEKLKLTKANIKKLINNRPINIINLKYIINLLQLSFITGKYKKYTYNYIEYMKKMLRYMDCDPKYLSVSRIDKIREHIYTLKVKQIDSITVIKYILSYFLKKDIPDKKKNKLCIRVAELEHRMTTGNKDPLYIENIYYSIMRIMYSKE